MSIYEKLSKVQSELSVPKSNWNKYSEFYYRSAEDILEALKPLLGEHKLVLTIKDEVKMIGERYYVEAQVTLVDAEAEGKSIVVTAYARETESRKGMDASQITGSTSSYARKYALNGLFAIDDTKDSDTMNNKEPKQEKKGNKKPVAKSSRDEKLKQLYAIAKERNIESEIADYIKTAYSKEASKDLTEKEVDELLEVAKGIGAK